MQTSPNLVTIDLDTSADGDANALKAVVDGVAETLERADTQATFFAPHAVAENHPGLLRGIAERGHEVACLTTQQPAKSKPYCSNFISELEVTRQAIEQATGKRVRGHRNASFAIDHESEWAYDVLVDAGFEYDSSRFPHKHADIWFQPIPRTVHVVQRWGGTLIEVPVSTTDVMAVRVQLGATSSLRGLPMPVWSAVMRDRHERGETLVLHLRASELQPTRSLLRTPAATSRRTLERFNRIVSRFEFTSVANAIPRLLRTAPLVET
jgi:hypothetical protein